VTPYDLTARELQIARLTANGYQDDEIAAVLHVSAGTVRQTAMKMRRKMGCRNRYEVIAMWIREQEQVAA
jgi:two-component system response regulator DesR